MRAAGLHSAGRGSRRDVPRILFSLGDNFGAAESRPIWQNSTGFSQIAHWYNGPGDLSWMNGYAATSRMSDIYGDGRSIELIIWTADTESGYPLSAEFLTDFTTLMNLFIGNGPNYGPLYIVLFTEVETYSEDPAALRARFVECCDLARGMYNQVYLGIGFGGYRWGASETSDFTGWESVIDYGDFVGVQHMNRCFAPGRVLMNAQIPRSIADLSQFRKPIFVSHFKFWQQLGDGDTVQDARDAFDEVLDNHFTDEALRLYHRQGLRAWNFMDDEYIREDAGSNSAYARALRAVDRFGQPTRTLRRV